MYYSTNTGLETTEDERQWALGFEPEPMLDGPLICYGEYGCYLIDEGDGWRAIAEPNMPDGSAGRLIIYMDPDSDFDVDLFCRTLDAKAVPDWNAPYCRDAVEGYLFMDPLPEVPEPVLIAPYFDGGSISLGKANYNPLSTKKEVVNIHRFVEIFKEVFNRQVEVEVDTTPVEVEPSDTPVPDVYTAPHVENIDGFALSILLTLLVLVSLLANKIQEKNGIVK